MIAVLKIPMNAWKVSAKSHARPMDIMEEKKKAAELIPTTTQAPEAPAAAPAPLAKGSCGPVMLHDVPDRTAAMIMAIVADELKTPLNELRFISIKEVK